MIDERALHPPQHIDSKDTLIYEISWALQKPPANIRNTVNKTCMRLVMEKEHGVTHSV